VVVSSYRLFIPNELDNRWLETTTPSAPAKERGHFLMAQPPLCAEHVQQLGSENLLSNLMEVKD
jgi:hypothetical protein